MAVCQDCGAEIPPGAGFCPKCGSPVSQPFEKSYREMRRELRESRHGYRHGIWWTPEWSLLNAVIAGLVVIYIGAIMYLASAGLTSLVTWANVWAYLLIGLGTFLFVRGIARFLMSGRRIWFGSVLGGIVLLAIGLAALAVSMTGQKEHIWTIAIVAGGVLIVAVGVGNYLLTKR